MRSLKHLNPLRIRHPLAPDHAGDEYNGAFAIRRNGQQLLVIASSALGWDHVSVSLRDRCPTWDEMKAIKEMFFRPDEWAIEYHPPAAANISVHDYCLHLWRPHDATIPTPPRVLV